MKQQNTITKVAVGIAVLGLTSMALAIAWLMTKLAGTWFTMLVVGALVTVVGFIVGIVGAITNRGNR